MAQLWPPFIWTAWAHPATVVEDKTGEGAALALIAWSVWVKPATELASTTDEDATLASLCSHADQTIRLQSSALNCRARHYSG